MDKLAQKMPVVSEKEKEECIGGDYYYQSSSWGLAYIGEFETGDELRLINPSFTGSFSALDKSQKYRNSWNILDNRVSYNIKNQIIRNLIIGYSRDIRFAEFRGSGTYFGAVIADFTGMVIGTTGGSEVLKIGQFIDDPARACTIYFGIGLTGTVSCLNGQANAALASAGMPSRDMVKPPSGHGVLWEINEPW